MREWCTVFLLGHNTVTNVSVVTFTGAPVFRWSIVQSDILALFFLATARWYTPQFTADGFRKSNRIQPLYLDRLQASSACYVTPSLYWHGFSPIFRLSCRNSTGFTSRTYRTVYVIVNVQFDHLKECTVLLAPGIPWRPHGWCHTTGIPFP